MVWDNEDRLILESRRILSWLLVLLLALLLDILDRLDLMSSLVDILDQLILAYKRISLLLEELLLCQVEDNRAWQLLDPIFFELLLLLLQEFLEWLQELL